MSFNSLVFFLFYLLIFFLVKRISKYRGVILLSGSLLFYFYAGITDICLVTFSILINYFLSLKVTENKARLFLIIFCNVVILSFFKYRYFFVPDISYQLDDIFNTKILLPLGISFYTFQILSYQIDLYRKKVEQIKSLKEFSFFVLFFPQVIAGPIVRANEFFPQIKNLFRSNHSRLIIYTFGLLLCVQGVVKKVVFADSLAPYSDAIFNNTPADAFTAWLGSYLFAFQIYFDFSGYCDIAIGAAYMLGIKLPVNFRQPYLAVNPRDFWKRWHITLSNWIRDYIYIPLGGGQNKKIFFNFLILISTMMLAGLWHGANWTFIVWGAIWGGYIYFSRYIPKNRLSGSLIHWFFHFSIVLLLWVIFRSSSMSDALTYIQVMFGFQHGNYAVGLNHVDKLLIILGCSLLMFAHQIEKISASKKVLFLVKKYDNSIVHGILIAIIFWLLVYPGDSNTPFIYFRF
jgi:alginate O-acetyltransferase complex protein AlgI